MQGLKHVTIPLAAGTASLVTAAGTAPFFKAPSGANGGGVSIREVYGYVASGTITVTLIDAGASGTAAVGTVCALAIAQATRAPFAGTPSAYYLAAGNHLAVVSAAGTIIAPAQITVGYVDGK